MKACTKNQGPIVSIILKYLEGNSSVVKLSSCP